MENNAADSGSAPPPRPFGASLHDPIRPVLSVVTCLYNEAECVPELVQRVVESCRLLAVPFEFLVVNDGSEDATLSRLIALGTRVSELRIANLFRRFGHMAALSAGIVLARGEAIIVMDGDLQDPPELIPALFKQWRGGAEVVYVSVLAGGRRSQSAWRSPASIHCSRGFRILRSRAKPGRLA